MRPNESPRLIRLTDVGQKHEPQELLVNVDHIRRVETVVGSGEYGDRIRLILHLAGEVEPVEVAAVDQYGQNTVLERSEHEVLRNFHAILDARGIGEKGPGQETGVPDRPVRSRAISRTLSWEDPDQRW